MNSHAGVLIVIHKYVRTPKTRYSCRDWEYACNGGQAEPDLHELHNFLNSGSGTSMPETPLRATLGWSYSGLRLLLVTDCLLESKIKSVF